MQTKKIKEEICRIGKMIYELGFASSNDGNISYRINDDEIWATPTGVSKGFMTPEMLVRVNIKNEILEGDRNPSSEIKMHLKVYEKRRDIKAVIHAHPPVSTAFAVCRKPLNKNYLPEGIVNLGDVLVAEYATPSTEDVPKSIEPFLLEYNAVLLANHGVLTWADNLIDSFYKLQTVEYLAQLYINVEKIGQGIELPVEEVKKLIELRSFYKSYSKNKKNVE